MNIIISQYPSSEYFVFPIRSTIHWRTHLWMFGIKFWLKFRSKLVWLCFQLNYWKSNQWELFRSPFCFNNVAHDSTTSYCSKWNWDYCDIVPLTIQPEQQNICNLWPKILSLFSLKPVVIYWNKEPLSIFFNIFLCPLFWLRIWNICLGRINSIYGNKYILEDNHLSLLRS